MPYAHDHPLTDEILLALVIQKDATAFEALYDRHACTLYNIILRVVRDPHVAQDLLQDVFWQIWQKAQQYSGTGSVIAWLACIARNKALDELRQQRSRPRRRTDTRETMDDSLVAPKQSPEQAVEEQWTQQQVQRALATIPPAQRLCLQLAYFDGLSHSAIASQINVPLGTIKTRIRIGLEKVRHILPSLGLLRLTRAVDFTSP